MSVGEGRWGKGTERRKEWPGKPSCIASFSLFFVMCATEEEIQGFFRELFSDSVLMRSHSCQKQYVQSEGRIFLICPCSHMYIWYARKGYKFLPKILFAQLLWACRLLPIRIALILPSCGISLCISLLQVKSAALAVFEESNASENVR